MKACVNRSHFTKVEGWAIFMQQKLSFGQVCNTEKILGRLWAIFMAFFSCFHRKKNCLKSIIATKKLYNIIFYKNLGQETFSIMSLSTRNTPPRCLCIMTGVNCQEKSGRIKRRKPKQKRCLETWALDRRGQFLSFLKETLCIDTSMHFWLVKLHL